MQIRGQVLKARPYDFKDGQGKPIFMLDLDVYDETAGVVSCSMPQGSFTPLVKQDIVASVSGMKQDKYKAGGVKVSLRDVKPLVSSASAPGASTPPVTQPPESRK